MVHPGAQFHPSVANPGRPGGDLGRGAGSWVGRWQGQVTAGPERRGLNPGGVAKGCFGTSRAPARAPRAYPGEGTVNQTLGTTGRAWRGASQEMTSEACARGGVVRGGPGRRGRGPGDLSGAWSPRAGPGPLPGGVYCLVRPPCLSPPPLPAAPCMVWAPRSPRLLPPPTAPRPSPVGLKAALDPDTESADPAPRRPPETRRARSGPR